MILLQKLSIEPQTLLTAQFYTDCCYALLGVYSSDNGINGINCHSYCHDNAKKPQLRGLHIIEGKMGQKERTLDKTDDNLIARYIHTMAFFLISP